MRAYGNARCVAVTFFKEHDTPHRAPGIYIPAIVVGFAMSSIATIERNLRAHEALDTQPERRAQATDAASYARLTTAARAPQAPKALPTPKAPRAVPQAARCPLTGQPFVDPVVLLGDGYTYERYAIANYVRAVGPLSPQTHRDLASFATVPNWVMRHYVEACERDAQPTAQLECPISKSLLVEPVINHAGHTYDAASLAQWYALRFHQQLPLTAPLTNEPADAHAWAPNHTVSQLIDEITTSDAPLHHAAVRGNLVAVRALSSGAQQVLSDTLRLTPLMLASKYGHLACVRALLAAGSNVDTITRDDADQRTALFWATSGGFTQVVSALLGAHANPNTATAAMSPLMEAARQGYSDIAALLLAAGADATARNQAGHNAVWFAAFNQHADTQALVMRAFVRQVALGQGDDPHAA